MSAKVYLSDAAIKRAAWGDYRIPDSKLPGFFLHVGAPDPDKGRPGFKTLRLKLDVREADGPHTRGYSWKWPAVTADKARAEAQELRDRRDRGEPLEGTSGHITLLQTWQHYKAMMEKTGRSAGTIKDYTDKVMRCLKSLHHRPLAEISREHDVMPLHKEITEKGSPRSEGSTRKRKPAPYLANGTMRVACALFNFAADELDKPLPGKNPFRGKYLHNKEARRPAKLDEGNLAAWFETLTSLENPIWREWFWLALLTGLRRRTIERMAVADVHFDKGYIEIPRPKGGKERNFRVPITQPIRRCLERAIDAGAPLRDRFPQCAPWVFPSTISEHGHVTQPSSQTRINKKTTPHDLRRAFILFATGAGVIKTHRHVLTNHRVAKDVHEEYMTVPAMFAQLSDAQERTSKYILKHVGKGAEATLERLMRRDLAPKAQAA